MSIITLLLIPFFKKMYFPAFEVVDKYTSSHIKLYKMMEEFCKALHNDIYDLIRVTVSALASSLQNLC